jgi:hypothetical protein
MWKAVLNLLARSYEDASAFFWMWIRAGVVGIIAVWFVRLFFDLSVRSFSGALTPTILEETIILLLSAIVTLLFAIDRKLSRPKP